MNVASRARRTIRILLPVLLALACAVPSLPAVAPLASADSVSGWSEMTTPSSEILRDVWGASGTDVYAVGEGGTVFHYNGGGWAAMDAGTTTAYFEGVWGSSGSDVFAVGRDGVIYQYDGSWGPMTSNTSEDLLEVWGDDSNDVFAVGTGGTILRYSGGYWSPMASGTANPIEGVWGSSGTDVFAVGAGILHCNGSTWIAMNPGVGGAYFSKVWGSSSSDVFAVGYDGIIVHYDGDTWTPMNSGTSVDLFGVWGSGSDVFAVGASDTVLHYDGNLEGDWAPMPPGTTGSDYVDVWCGAANDVFTVTGFGRIFHWGGLGAPTVTTEALTSSRRDNCYRERHGHQ